jgi:biotin operon repressor
VPNILFDEHLPKLEYTELKVLLVIIRSTLGWRKHPNTKERVERNWINGRQLRERTGCSRRAITSAIETLVRKGLIVVTDYSGRVLLMPVDRKGKTRLYYSANLGENSMLQEQLEQSMRRWLETSAQELAQGMRMD